MKMNGRIRRLAVCLALILAMLAGTMGNVLAETMITLEGVANGGSENGHLTGLRVSGLAAPVPGLPRVDRVLVTSAEGMSWEIPVLWLDENGTVAEGIVWSDQLQPVLVFYLPEGYCMDGLSLTLLDDVAAVFGDQGILSVWDKSLGLTYIFPGNIELSVIEERAEKAVHAPIPGMPEEEHVKDGGYFHQWDEDDSDDEDEEWSKTLEPKPEEKPRTPVEIYCAKTARKNVAEEDLGKLVDLVVNRLQPQAVNLLKESFPCFKAAAAKGELGKELGFYVYYEYGDKDGNSAHERMTPECMGAINWNIWRDKKNARHPVLGYMLCLDAKEYRLTDKDGKYVLAEDGKYRLTDDMTNFENTLIHEMLHGFMFDYNRRGQTGFTSLDYFADYEKCKNKEAEEDKRVRTVFPTWFFEGLASSVENVYQYRHESFQLFRYDREEKALGKQYSSDALLSAYVNPEFSLRLDPESDYETSSHYFDLEKADDEEVNTEPSRYVTGYLAALYIGEMATQHARRESSIMVSKKTGKVGLVDNEAILAGLNDVLTSLHEGKTLDAVIREISDGRYESIDDFEERFIKGVKLGDDYTGDAASIDFCVDFLNFMREVDEDEYHNYFANGSILQNLSDDFNSPLDHKQEAQSDVYKIVESNSFVASTVDFWQDGGKSISGNPSYNTETKGEEPARPAGEVMSGPAQAAAKEVRPQETAPEAVEAVESDAAPEAEAPDVPEESEPVESDAAPEAEAPDVPEESEAVKSDAAPEAEEMVVSEGSEPVESDAAAETDGEDACEASEAETNDTFTENEPEATGEGETES